MKKWCKFFVAAMVLSAGTGMFSGCIENIEPESLSQLRGAKTELIKAQVAIQAAQAAKIQADAALVNAQAKLEEANAQKALYQAEYEKLLLEEKTAENSKRLAEIQLEMQGLEVAAQIALLQAKTELANTELAYDQAIKDLKAARLSLSSGQKAYLAEFELNVTNCKDEVDYYTNELERAGDLLEIAIANLDKEQASKINEMVAKRAVVKAEAKVEALNEAVSVLEEMLKLDTQVNEWIEAKESLEEEIKTLEASLTLDVEKNDAIDVLLKQKEDLIAKASEVTDYTGHTFSQISGRFSYLPVASGPTSSWSVPEIYVEAPVDENNENIFDTKDFYIRENELFFQYDDSQEADEYFDERISALSYLDADWFDEQIENYNNLIEQVETNYADDVEEYNAAVAAYEADDVFSYLTEYDSDYEDFDESLLVEEYNAALDAFNAAINTYETELEKYSREDNSQVVLDIETEYNEQLDAALYERVKAYQAAQEVYYKACVVYETAKNKYDRAERAYGYVKMEVKEATGSDVLNTLEKELEKLNAVEDPSGAQEARIALLEENIAKLKEAEKEFGEEEEEYSKAEDVRYAAYRARMEAREEADEVYEAAERAIKDARDDALADLNVGSGISQIDGEYRDYLRNKVVDSIKSLNDLCEEVELLAVREKEWMTIRLEKEYYGTISLYVPDFALSEDGEELIELQVSDLSDKEYFLEEVVADLAEDLINVTVRVRAYFNNGSYDTYRSEYITYRYLDIVEDFPLVLPDNEKYNEFIAESLQAAGEQVTAELLQDGFVVDRLYTNIYSSPSFAMIYEYQNNIDNCEKAKAYLPQLAEFMASIQAAKTVYEDYKTEMIAQVDELMAYVETEWPAVAEALAEYENEKEQVEAKVQELTLKLNNIVDAIECWVSDASDEEYTDVDRLVAYLEEELEETKDEVIEAEEELAEAKYTLENIYTELTENVNLAQKEYDAVLADLQEATSELEAATAELDAAITAVKDIE